MHDAMQIVCFDSLAEVSGLWLPFQQHARATAYNSHQWASAWQETVGARLRAEPRVLAGFDRQGSVQFILPLQLRRAWGMRVLQWHGAPDVPYGMGLFAEEFLPHAADWFSSNLGAVLAKAGKFDLLQLDDMPERMFGHPHPLASSFNLASANATYILNLGSNFEEVYARKRNAETRRANRRKDSRMAELGALKFRQITDRRKIPAMVDVMLQHKIARLAAEGIHGVFTKDVRRMVHKLAGSQGEGQPLFTLHALTLDDNLLACTFGGWMNGTYSFYISSIGPEGPVTRHSPGDYALRKTIEQCCEAGLESFDFGPGSAAYKTGWTDETVQLFSTIRANNIGALVLAAYKMATTHVKRRVKSHAGLRDLAFKLRRVIRARRPAD